MHVIEVQGDDGKLVHYLSILGPEQFVKGLRSEAILGRLTAGPDRVDPAHFVPNPVFVKFLGWVIARHALGCPGLVAEVARQRDGFVYISDARVQNADGSVAKEDLIGCVEIREGKILRFIGSPNYRAFTAAGPPKIDPWLHERWVEELSKLP